MMPVDARTFKEILSRWATGITVVTCRRPGGIHGMTANSFCSVSLNPPLVLVCVNRQGHTHQYIEDQRAFGVHILGTGMEDLSNRCAGFLGEEAHWLEDVPHRTAATGAPILQGALAWMDCSLWGAYDGGDHSIFVGEIEAGGTDEGSPILWFNRGYREMGP
jgi:flavin reductase (DIM6/NTAB) family NADH-FMN oxidoreductase RutF